MGTFGIGRVVAHPINFGRLRFGRLRACVGILAAALAAACAGGCSTAPQASVTPAAMHGATVAFESIDGPPPSVFSTLVSDLGDEAVARQIAIVSRESPAQYRVRGYLAALVEARRRTTMIAWVWDVYDSDQQRVLRISGEEPASSAGKGTWAAADDTVLRRIAQTGMDRLAAFLAAPGALPAAPATPSDSGPRVASTDGPAAGADAVTSALAFERQAP
jgi:hypothetical protein